MKSIQERLKNLATEKHKKFQEKLIPNITNILGVKTPELRKLSKELLKSENPLEYLKIEKEYFEEIVLEGLIIGGVKIDIEKKLEIMRDYIPKIDNWATCDIFCSAIKDTKKNKESILEFIKPYLKSSKEFEIRFAVVTLLSYYIEKEYLNLIFNSFDLIKHEGYYVKMGVAWTISICFVKFPIETMAYLKNNNLDKFTFNKSLQKIIESFRVDSETKKTIKLMKKG
ncbi:MAG: DNA alkylation repair protein [Fusobacteriaceae bacterium]|nr:DNA alkylation repair protein [Fusobacteriaceae bacterium]MBN2838900.1 DNA alkylation repair protein [Fusobacteriaceae bacterium]